MNTKVEKWMRDIREYIAAEYGQVSPAWEFQLELFKQNLEQYFTIKDILDTTGYFDSQRGLKNPLISSLKDLNAIILKQASMFGLNVMSRSKIKLEKSDDTEDFIESLTK